MKKTHHYRKWGAAKGVENSLEEYKADNTINKQKNPPHIATLKSDPQRKPPATKMGERRPQRDWKPVMQ